MSERTEWNHVPEVPIRIMPLWQWPPKPYAVFRWYFDSWFFLTVNGAIAGLAFMSYFLLGPQLADIAGWSWVLTIWLRNLAIVACLAGGLHLWFHKYQVQGNDLKYDPRPYPRAARVFFGGNQLHDNIFWTLGSGVTVWTALECLVLWQLAQGNIGMITFGSNPVWFVAVFFLIPIWESFYFYWIHRLLHTRLFYRFHALHHKNTDIGPWSGLSMHPVEHVLYFGSVLIHFAIASHPVHVIFHLMFYGLYAITTHTGFEGVLFRNKKRLHLGNFHHQIHHRYFECNYGTIDVPWDILFGSWHDGTPEGKDKMRQRLKKRASLRT